ncbi:MAG: M23 family metallopeptidase, partial [Deltaproteobacteria bacterium]
VIDKRLITVTAATNTKTYDGDTTAAALPTRTTCTHVGVDFAAPTGAPVISVADGHVVDVGMRGGYGNLIVIEHAGGYTTRYAHLSGFAPDIEIGSEVRRGSEIGYVGTTGFSTGPHLHFEIRRDGVYFDPLDERLAFGLWSMRPADYVPMMRQTLIAEATDRLSAAGLGTVLQGPVAAPVAGGEFLSSPLAAAAR